MWLAGLLPPLFLTGIVTLALSGAEPPSRIQTFSHASWAEQQFDRRCLKLRKVGLATVGLAILVSIAVGIQLLR